AFAAGAAESAPAGAHSLVCLHNCNQVAVEAPAHLPPAPAAKALAAAPVLPGILSTGPRHRPFRSLAEGPPDHPRPPTFLLVQSFLI
ncbi:MAG TPA: hypothetical protein VKA48_01175, partial [Gammaproteobacteria bacterium]|nr:hypothetical protein [Gammaproteobacteria bacterium]